MSRNKDLAAALTDKHGLSKQDAEKFVNAMWGLINDSLAKEKLVKVKGLGTFKVISVAPRKSVNVNTGDPIVIEGRDKITFTPDASMRDEVNKPFAQFDTVVVNDGVDFTGIDKKYSEEEEIESAPEPIQEAEPTKEAEPMPEAEPVAEPEIEVPKEEVPKIEVPKAEEKEVEVPQTEEKEVVEEPQAEEENSEEQLKEDLVIAETEVKSDEAEIKSDETEIKYQHRSLTIIIVAAAIIVALCISGAFYMYTQIQKRDNRIANLEAQVMASTKKANNKPAVKKAKAPQTQEQPLTKEILTASADNQQTEKADLSKDNLAKEESVNKETKKAEAKKEELKQTTPNYDSDPRIRTGAYNIIGIEKTMTVKAGQTLSSISRLYYGPGMECYVEAVNNGKTEYKAGEKINLPKLKHKKKK